MPITLLLADDSVVIQKLVGLSFANEDIELVAVDNGDDAVTRAFECKPDIVLADVVMPGKSGYEVCSEIRNNPELAGTPVLLLTGTFEAFDESRASDVGATGHITKPFEAQALVDRVHQILAERTSAPDTSQGGTAASNDFFDDNIGNLGESTAPGGVPAMPSSTDPQAGGAPMSLDMTEVAGLDMDEVNAHTVALDPISGYDNLNGGMGGAETIAIMPDDFGDELLPDAAVTPIPSPPAASAPPVPVATETPNPDQTMLVDDFFSQPEPMPVDFADVMPEVNVDSPTKSTIGTVELTGAPTPDPMASLGPISQPVIEPPPPVNLETIAPPPAPAPSSDLDDLSFSDDPQMPSGDLGGANLDTTMLADDIFGSGPDISGAGELADSFEPELTDPVSSQLPPSQGLDIDFGSAPAADSIVPDNASDYDVSTSDLRVDPSQNDPSWSQGIPAGVVTEPAPIATPLVQTSPPAPAIDEPVKAAEVVSMEDAPSPSLEPSWNAPSESAPAPEIGFAPSSPDVDTFDETRDAIAPPSTPVEDPGVHLASEADNRPDLTPAMQDRIHDTLEKVAWEAFSDLSDDIVRQLMKRVEQIAWEVIPQMAETLIQDEIRRMKGEEGEAGESSEG